MEGGVRKARFKGGGGVTFSLSGFCQAAIVNNTKRSSPGEGKWSLKLVAIEIEPRLFFPEPIIPAIMEVKGCSKPQTADISVKTLELFEMG